MEEKHKIDKEAFLELCDLLLDIPEDYRSRYCKAALIILEGLPKETNAG